MASTGARNAKEVPGGDTVLVAFEDGIAWVTMNRPDKRNAVSPTLAAEMLQVMDALETDPAARCWCSPARANRSPPAWT